MQALLRDPDPAHQPGPHRGGQDVPLLLRQDQRQPRQGEQGHHLTIASIILTTYHVTGGLWAQERDYIL